MLISTNSDLPVAILDILPNPVLVKDANLRYVWTNAAFNDLFRVRRDDLIGKSDAEVFPDRQAIQCNGGDLRVLESGGIDEAYETIYKNGIEPRVTITRKNRLTISGENLLIGVMHDVTEVTNANHALEDSKQKLEAQSLLLAEMAYTDPLTGVLNRRRFSELAESTLGKHRNIGGMLICDLDHFKQINDTYGHDAGDAALLHFVEIAGAALREGDLIARLGGEEFACLLAGTTTKESVDIAECIRQALEVSPLIYKSNIIEMTVSIGLAQHDGKPFSLDDMFSEADQSLYAAKNKGRNRIEMAA